MDVSIAKEALTLLDNLAVNCPTLGKMDLPFNVIKLSVLVIWFFACLYCTQKVQLNPKISDSAKPTVNLISLFIGPLVVLVLFVRAVRERSRDSDQTIMEALRDHLSNIAESIRSAGRSEDMGIHLLDTSGRSIKDIYGHSRSRSVDRQTLDLTEQIILDALQERASDILIDPKDDSIHTIRFRIDGVLREVEQIDADTCQAVINSIKAVSNMDIAEKRRPQDGAFVAKTEDQSLAFRVASAGALQGEKLSIRVLYQNAEAFQINSIGLSSKQQAVIKDAIAKPSGMILMCGPTGSGKTTTLYAMLNKIDLLQRNVITVEDPIEYVLPNASQIEVNPKADITFAASLRSILRQDPDVICVGEIRDEETAIIALRAAQTGHLVLATVHSTGNASALIRLLDLGITPMMLSTGLSLVVSQRLVRVLCRNCRVQAKLTQRQIHEFTKRQINYANMHEAGKCEQCHMTGYKGRIGIYDVLVIDDTVRQNILNNEIAISQLRQEADKRGKSNLQKQGLKKVVCGLTSMEELNRVMGKQ